MMILPTLKKKQPSQKQLEEKSLCFQSAEAAWKLNCVCRIFQFFFKLFDWKSIFAPSHHIWRSWSARNATEYLGQGCLSREEREKSSPPRKLTRKIEAFSRRPQREPHIKRQNFCAKLWVWNFIAFVVDSSSDEFKFMVDAAETVAISISRFTQKHKFSSSEMLSETSNDVEQWGKHSHQLWYFRQHTTRRNSSWNEMLDVFGTRWIDSEKRRVSLVDGGFVLSERERKKMIIYSNIFAKNW